MDMLERHFHIRERGSNIRQELLGGFTMFFTAAYLVVIVAGIMAPVAGADETAVGCLICFFAAVSCLLTGFLSNLPFAAAPGLGFALFFSQTLVGRYGYSFSEALPVVFFSGVLFLVISLTPLRECLLEAIPLSFKFAVSAGVGLMVTLSGLINAGLVTAENNLLDMGNIISPGPLLAFVGVFITSALLLRKVPGAVLIGMFCITVLGIPFGITKIPEQMFAGWNMSFAAFHLSGVLEKGALPFVSALLALLLSDCFDVAGTLLGVAGDAKMTDNTGDLEGSGRAMAAVAVSTCAGALAGVPNSVLLVESAVGVREGARTGLSSIVTGLLFLAAVPFVPLLGLIPGAATAAALIVVGMGMMSGISQITWKHVEITLPCFLIIVGMPFTGSITDGIALGCISYVVVMVCRRRAKVVNPWMYVLAGLFVLMYVFQIIT